MAEGFIIRKGGVAATKTPSLNFVSKTDTEIVFTITNNDTETVDVFWELGDNTPDANQIELTAGQTSSNQTVSGLNENTEYTIFAFANKAGKAGSGTVSLTQTTDVNPYIEATGGTVNTYSSGGKNYKSHTFTSSGTFTVTKVGIGSFNQLDYLIVAGGGGGGGNYYAGGGGGGGLVYKQKTDINTINYTVTVGAGGTSASLQEGNNGSNSTVFGDTAIGGGGGGMAWTSNHGATDGGSGGGGGGGGVYIRTAGDALQPTSSSGGFGNDGADGNNTLAGGGGGAGQVGGIGATANGGDGLYYGDEFTNNYGENGYFAGGGGGAYDARDIADGRTYPGGIGGGGRSGSYNPIVPPENGQSNTGGGGGGSNYDDPSIGYNGEGGTGGSGIVIIRYEVGGL